MLLKLLQSTYQQIRKTQQWPQDWKKSVFIPIPRNGSAKECSSYQTISLISHVNKVMHKIFKARFQQYFQMYKLDLEKTGTRDQIANISWIIEKAREFQKNIYFCFIEYAKAFDYVDHNKLLNIHSFFFFHIRKSNLLYSVYGFKHSYHPETSSKTHLKKTLPKLYSTF